MGVLTSCDPNEDPNVMKVTVTSSNEYPAPGDVVTITVSVTSETEKLSEVTIKANADDSTSTQITLADEKADASDLSFSKTFDITVSEALKDNAAITVIVTATDSKDNTEEAQLKLTTSYYFKNTHQDQVIGHLYGPLKGAYDLVEGGGRSIGEPNAEKDMADNSENDKEFSGLISAPSESGSTYIDLGKNYSFDALNAKLAADLFADRSPATEILVSKDTKFLVKLRGNNSYAAIHVTAYEPEHDEDASGDDLGRIVFDVYYPER